MNNSTTPATGPRRRRSALVVPGSVERKITKSIRAGADEIVFDLEDAVPMERKTEARELVVESLVGGHRWANTRLAVRVNAVGTPWCHLDILACAAQPLLGSIVLPKVHDPGDIAFVDRLLDGIGSASGCSASIGIQALIESAVGLTNIHTIASASERVEALVLGFADLASSLDRAFPGAVDDWRTVQDTVVVAARTAGAQAIDGPVLGTAVDKEFESWTDAARRLGFDGKWVIHPTQVNAVTAAFTPTSEELSRARAILDALEWGVREGSGVVALDGQMLDEAVARAARRVLARAATDIQ